MPGDGSIPKVVNQEVGFKHVLVTENTGDDHRVQNDGVGFAIDFAFFQQTANSAALFELKLT